jgi:hypothetical protein
MKEKQYDWIDLWSAYSWMRETFPFSIYNKEGALKNALLSGEIPTRGKDGPGSAYQRIEKAIPADIEVTVNMIRSKWTMVRFEAVQIDRPSFETWIRSNAIEHSEAPTAAAKARAAKPDANYEHEVTIYLTGLLRKDPNMGPDDAWWECRLRFQHLRPRSSRMFRRIWAKARDEAGLKRQARPGPRAKHIR